MHTGVNIKEISNLVISKDSYISGGRLFFFIITTNDRGGKGEEW